MPGTAAAGLAAVLLLAGGAAAQAPVPAVTLLGAGAGASCADWRAAAGAAADPGLVQWAFGFASALGAAAQARDGGGADPLARLDGAAVAAWLEAYCAARPGDGLALALARMVHQAAAAKAGAAR